MAYNQYDYMLFKFTKPAGYSTGSCRWRVAGTGHEVYLYLWYYTQQIFVRIDINEGGQSPSVRYITVPGSWFSPEGVLHLMAVVEEEPPEDRIKCDVKDIQ